ncbi:IS3 family transposase [Bounagaea algeriensis]
MFARAPRVTAERCDQGNRINRKRVPRLMRARGIVGRHPTPRRPRRSNEQRRPRLKTTGREPDIRRGPIWCPSRLGPNATGSTAPREPSTDAANNRTRAAPSVPCRRTDHASRRKAHGT